MTRKIGDANKLGKNVENEYQSDNREEKMLVGCSSG